MASKKKDDSKPEAKESKTSKMYKDYDLYDWSGKQTDSGADVRRKGTDR